MARPGSGPGAGNHLPAALFHSQGNPRRLDHSRQQCPLGHHDMVPNRGLAPMLDRHARAM